MLLTNHPDERALYTGVIANPLDEAPRLIIADWYEENGYEWRANFIKGKPPFIGLSLLVGDDDVPQYFDWHQRIKSSLMDQGVLRWSFVRGFITTITICTQSWIYHHKSILAENPLQEVNIEATPNRRGGPAMDVKYFRNLTRDSHPWLKVHIAHPI